MQERFAWEHMGFLMSNHFTFIFARAAIHSLILGIITRVHACVILTGSTLPSLLGVVERFCNLC